MLLISEPRIGRSDDEDSDLVFDSFTLSAILKSKTANYQKRTYHSPDKLFTLLTQNYQFTLASELVNILKTTHLSDFYTLHVAWGFSPSVLLTFWVGHSLLWGLFCVL